MTVQAGHYYILGNQRRFTFKLMLEWTQTKETTFEIGIPQSGDTENCYLL
jgi:hypothetical protein